MGKMEVVPANRMSMRNTLANWLTHLESLHPKSISMGLERVETIKQRLNLNPQFPIVVVGGTNGKGSVCAMLESIFHAAGFRVGCYTSPHLLRYNERVRVARMEVSDEDLCAAFEDIEKVRGDIRLTYFEYGTLAAMQCFISSKVEVAILEVGLGGRLDAVNVFDGDCVVVTNVDIDHTDYLGTTREQIAHEKAGIFRKGRVCIFADFDVPIAIAEQASKIGAELWRIGSEFSFKYDLEQWDYHSKTNRRNALPHPALRGTYQLNNASAVLAVLDTLHAKLPVAMGAVRRGLAEVQLSGRFQLIPGKPALIMDVAHNPHAARSLAQNLSRMPPCQKTFAVFAMLKDKDIAGVAAAMNLHVDSWLLASIGAKRGATSGELEKILEHTRVAGEITVHANVADALRFAYKAAGENDRIIAFGSFYTVADVMAATGTRR
ncbi:MAG: bifunctional tetrahydrofolate synthase/dihydrofolate synthase [Gallionella sp.]